MPWSQRHVGERFASCPGGDRGLGPEFRGLQGRLGRCATDAARAPRFSLSSIRAIVYLACAATVLAGSLLSLGSAFAAEALVVVSGIDTEGAVLGHLIAQALEREGGPLTERIQSGGTRSVRALPILRGDRYLPGGWAGLNS